MNHDEERFVELVLSNPVNRAILERGAELGVSDWWLTAGAVFQTVWNLVDGQDPRAGIVDYDLFYFDDSDLAWEAEDAVIARAAVLFADLGVPVEVRNEARVHLWYAGHFGVPAAAFTSTRDAVDHFASTTCCVALTRGVDGQVEVYAPHGFGDVFASAYGRTRSWPRVGCTRPRPPAGCTSGRASPWTPGPLRHRPRALTYHRDGAAGRR